MVRIYDAGRVEDRGEGDPIVFAAAEGERRRTVRLYGVSAAALQGPEPIGPDPEGTTIAGSRLPLFLPDGTLLFNYESRLLTLNGTSGEPISGGGDLIGEVQYVRPG